MIDTYKTTLTNDALTPIASLSTAIKPRHQPGNNTHLVAAGRHPERFAGLVNTPVFRGSTILSASLAEWEGYLCLCGLQFAAV